MCRANAVIAHQDFNLPQATRCLLHREGAAVGCAQISDNVVEAQRLQLVLATRGGHDPIPEVGQTVRAYIQRDERDYVVIDPNGFASVDGTQLVQAAAVKGLRRGGYTFLLPLEIWISAV